MCRYINKSVLVLCFSFSILPDCTRIEQEFEARRNGQGSSELDRWSPMMVKDV
jgi:hypothetical protein